MHSAPSLRRVSTMIGWGVVDATIWFVAVVAATWMRFQYEADLAFVANTFLAAAGTGLAHLALGLVIGPYTREIRRGSFAVVRSHHERWDGSGYPDGLAGESIPLLARMFSLVDVYDALTSERPYKPAWTHADAVAELQKQAGAQFDPRLVPLFLAALAETADQPEEGVEDEAPNQHQADDRAYRI